MPTTQYSFFAHQGNQAQNLLTDFMADVRREEPTWRVGYACGLPRYSPTTSRSLLADADQVSAYSLADPETHRLAEPFPDRGRGRSHLPYLQESDPRTNRERFVRNVLRAQVDAGRSILISPWLVHGATGSTRNLRATLRWAEMASEHPLAAGLDVLFGVATTEEILEDAADLDDLLDDLVDLPQGGIYFRNRVVAPTSYTQYSNRAALEGVRRLVEALRDNGRATVLPQAGLAGWLMLPFGATAFGSGVTASLQRFVAPTSGFGRPLEWYFMPELLGFVLRSEVSQLHARLGWDLCDCPYCGNLNFAGSLWNREAAGLHYLWWCSRLANELLGEADPAQSVRDRLQDARDNWSAVQAANVLLDDRSEPRHLGVWSAVVA